MRTPGRAQVRAERLRTLKHDLGDWWSRRAADITRGEVQQRVDAVKARAPRLAVMLLTDLRLAFETCHCTGSASTPTRLRRLRQRWQ